MLIAIFVTNFENTLWREILIWQGKTIMNDHEFTIFNPTKFHFSSRSRAQFAKSLASYDKLYCYEASCRSK